MNLKCSSHKEAGDLVQTMQLLQNKTIGLLVISAMI
jgi:hypothetical protein